MIVAPTDAGQGPTQNVVPIVGVAGSISAGGCIVWARNSDFTPGLGALNWIAFSEALTGGTNQPSLAAGLTQPNGYSTCGQLGDTRLTSLSLSYAGFNSSPTIIATATNANTRVHCAAAIPIASTSLPPATSLVARNSDCGAGDCSFYCIALGNAASISNASLIVDSGRSITLYFNASCYAGDWRAIPITFAKPFTTSPTVLVGTNNGTDSAPGNVVAAYGMAFNVTPYGFTLAARNSDIATGYAAFDWVAFGV